MPGDTSVRKHAEMEMGRLAGYVDCAAFVGALRRVTTRNDQMDAPHLKPKRE
jgi:hypothetical protein